MMYADAEAKASELETQQKDSNEEPKTDAAEKVWCLFRCLRFSYYYVVDRKHQLKQLIN